MIKYIDDKKVCSKCKIPQSINNYYKTSDCVDGLRPSCKICDKKLKDIYIKSEGYKDKKKVWTRRNYEKNKDYIKARTTAYIKNNPHIRKRSILNYQYGLSLEDYYILVNKNDKKCHICNIAPINNVLYVDHCHVTKKIRGVLCMKCNSLLGFCNDNLEILNSAIKYLIKEQSYGVAK